MVQCPDVSTQTSQVAKALLFLEGPCLGTWYGTEDDVYVKWTLDKLTGKLEFLSLLYRKVSRLSS